MLIVDTSAVLAQLSPQDPLARAVRRVLEAESDVPVMPLTVAAELDYMLSSRGGARANRSLLRDLASGRFHTVCLDTADFPTVLSLNERYRDLNVGLTDLSIVVIAARYNTTRILTFHQRHFRLLRPLQSGTFTLLPFDDPPAT